MSLSVRNSLIAAARSFREHDEPSAQNHLLAAGRESPQIETQVYRRLWEVMNRPTTHADFGRAAFWNLDRQTAPLSKKTCAIEDILNPLIQSSIPPRTEPVIPPGAQAVELDAFHDCGYDPSFDANGDYLLPEAKLSFGKWVRDWFAYAEFTLRAYLSFDPEERALRQMILSTARAETVFAKYTQSSFVDTDAFGTDIQNTFSSEHAFFNQTSDLYKTALPRANAPTRLFPSELLKGSHHLAKPQAHYWAKSHLRPENQNGDLSRCANVGLWRLRDEVYNTRGGSLDPFEYGFVPHYIFNHVTNAPSEALKTAIRSYRTTLSTLIVDAKCARSFAACKEKLLPSLGAFNTAWQNYADSHDILKEVQEVFSNKDCYKPQHDYQLWLQKMSSIPFFNTLHEKHITTKYNESHHWERHYQNEGYKLLVQTVKNEFPHSFNARLLNAADRPRNQSTI